MLKTLPQVSALAALSLIAAAAFATAHDRVERVRFGAGGTSATVKGRITGYDTATYVIGANAGQVISVLFSANNNACYFNFIEPGANSAIHMGDIAGNEYSARLHRSGDHRAEVFMMRSEARREKTCKYSITFEITGGGASSGSSSGGGSEGAMLATCRDRAHQILRTRLPDIAVKYEGQRTDGTHAVNGNATLNGRSETFQCSFDRNGSRIVQFIVNH